MTGRPPSLFSQSDYRQPAADYARYCHGLSDELKAALKKRQEETEDTATWPDVPYGYWMGRIKGYEEWLASLEPEARDAEITASQARYADYYRDKLERAHDVVKEIAGPAKKDASPDKQPVQKLSRADEFALECFRNNRQRKNRDYGHGR